MVGDGIVQIMVRNVSIDISYLKVMWLFLKKKEKLIENKQKLRQQMKLL